VKAREEILMPQTDAQKSQPSPPAPDTCSTSTDPSAPAGAKNSLGAKSDCNGRPSTDDSVVEAMDEQGPAIVPSPARSGDTRR
jgi:hypothetical protein